MSLIDYKTSLKYISKKNFCFYIGDYDFIIAGSYGNSIYFKMKYKLGHDNMYEITIPTILDKGYYLGIDPEINNGIVNFRSLCKNVSDIDKLLGKKFYKDIKNKIMDYLSFVIVN